MKKMCVLAAFSLAVLAWDSAYAQSTGTGSKGTSVDTTGRSIYPGRKEPSTTKPGTTITPRSGTGTINPSIGTGTTQGTGTPTGTTTIPSTKPLDSTAVTTPRSGTGTTTPAIGTGTTQGTGTTTTPRPNTSTPKKGTGTTKPKP